MKKFLFLFLFPIILLSASFFLFPIQVYGVPPEIVNVYFFWGDGCPHCAQEEAFLNSIRQKYPQMNLQSFEIWNDSGNRQILADIGKELEINISGIPFIAIGEKHFIGWYDVKTTGVAIEGAIEYAVNNQCRDRVGEIIGTGENKKDESIDDNNECEGDESADGNSVIPQTISVPILGKIKIKDFSLPVLTIIFGALDGFNPCAMWTLLFLISLLLGMKDRKRMWMLGTAFIIASSSVYFLFMSAWLNLLLFIGFLFWVRFLIAVIALVGGTYNLKEYFINPAGSCKVAGGEKRRRVFEKLKKIIHQRSFYLALAGIIILAFAVNLVELICSAGLPAVYTHMLTLSSLSAWQYYLYILFYIFIFMLDDLFVFFTAMIALRITRITTKYSRWSHLIGGILMFLIGCLLILKPSLLMFG